MATERSCDSCLWAAHDNPRGVDTWRCDWPVHNLPIIVVRALIAAEGPGALTMAVPATNCPKWTNKDRESHPTASGFPDP